jgi:hypothetical protein
MLTSGVRNRSVRGILLGSIPTVDGMIRSSHEPQRCSDRECESSEPQNRRPLTRRSGQQNKQAEQSNSRNRAAEK